MKNSAAPAAKREAEENGQKETETTATRKNRIMIYGPKTDGTYVIEFRTAAGGEVAISTPRTETAVVRYFQERMPHGLFVARRSVRNLWRVRVFPKRSPHLTIPEDS
jgi:hypothetical protein